MRKGGKGDIKIILKKYRYPTTSLLYEIEIRQLWKGDQEFPIHQDKQEVKTVAFQNHLQSPGIKLAKKSRSMHCTGFQSRVHNLVPLFGSKTIEIGKV